MADAWQNNDGQQMNRGYGQNGGASFGRSFNNSNYKGPRRDGGMNGGGGGGGGGYQGQRSYNNTGNGFGGGYRFNQNGAGRPYVGGGQPRMNNGGAPRQYNYDPSAPCSKIDIDSSKVGMVIGRGGGKIREIQDSFNVHVKIDRDPGLNGLTGVTIRGEEESIEQAKIFIQELIAVKIN